MNLGVGVPPPEYHIQCLSPLTKSGGDEELRLELDGTPFGVKLRVSQLSKQMVAGLPDRALDLLELAALVYGSDAAVSRGGTADQQMGRKWHRRFVVDMPVRDLAFWQDDDQIGALEKTLMFLSGDRFEFTFRQKTDPEAERWRFFNFNNDSAWSADRVLMFSGGLDSMAGALEEIAEHGHQVALVSHFSATKIAPVQRELRKALAEKFGTDCCRHVPIQVQMTGRGMKEGTHRSRSFLFAVLGAITAQAFGLDRVSFHENGVVSLNLPPVGNVLGTRATRTTHPQTLTRFTTFFSKVFEGGLRVDNPFFWRTKKDVVQTIARLNMKDQIAHTRSCADVHNQTKQHPHCGRCSQCIDRRFAMLAAGQEQYDPADAYRVDLMDDPRSGVVDREIALSYVRNAHAFEFMSPDSLERHFPAVLDAVNHLETPSETTLKMITDLLNRHGAGVSEVMRGIFAKNEPNSFREGSLPKLYGEVQSQVLLPAVAIPQTATKKTEAILMEIDEKKRKVVFDGCIPIERNASADLLIELSKAWLDGAGRGLALLDYPTIRASDLANLLNVDIEEVVRRRVMTARRLLRQRFQSSGSGFVSAEELIETLPWSGYRLAPDRIVVRRCSEPN